MRSSEFDIKTLYQGKGVVWGFDFVDNNTVIISHRDGDLFLYKIKDGTKSSLSAPKVYSKGQGGLLDVAFKKWKGKNYVFMTFSQEKPKNKQGKAVTALARGELIGDQLKNLQTIFVTNADGEGAIHFGSRLAFKEEKDGSLSIFMSVGERGERELAQDIHRHNGSILRLRFDGSAHPANPFVGKDGADEIYSIGHRNPQGLGINPADGSIINAEMGPRGGDEINLVKRGNNYGWPIATYGSEYYGPKIGVEKKEGMEEPITYWVPSISPSGMVFYTGDKIKQSQGDLFLACLSGEQIRKVKLRENKVLSQTEMLGDLGERFRQVRNGPGGYLYASTDSGKILKISSK